MNGDRTGARACGYDEEAVFAYLDGDLPDVSGETFRSHLATCYPCRTDLRAYESLYESLGTLAAPEPRAGFDTVVLSTVLGPASPAVQWPRGAERWAGARGLDVPLRFVVGFAAAMAAMVLFGLVAYTDSVGGWRQAAGLAVTHTVDVGVGVIHHGVASLTAAVAVSDAMLRVARTLEPIWRSLNVAAGAVDDGFWLLLMMVSLLALMGAVRLANGPVAERGVRRVSLFLA